MQPIDSTRKSQINPLGFDKEVFKKELVIKLNKLPPTAHNATPKEVSDVVESFNKVLAEVKKGSIRQLKDYVVNWLMDKHEDIKTEDGNLEKSKLRTQEAKFLVCGSVGLWAFAAIPGVAASLPLLAPVSLAAAGIGLLITGYKVFKNEPVHPLTTIVSSVLSAQVGSIFKGAQYGAAFFIARSGKQLFENADVLRCIADNTRQLATCMNPSSMLEINAYLNLHPNVLDSLKHEQARNILQSLQTGKIPWQAFSNQKALKAIAQKIDPEAIKEVTEKLLEIKEAIDVSKQQTIRTIKQVTEQVGQHVVNSPSLELKTDTEQTGNIIENRVARAFSTETNNGITTVKTDTGDSIDVVPLLIKQMVSIIIPVILAHQQEAKKKGSY